MLRRQTRELCTLTNIQSQRLAPQFINAQHRLETGASGFHPAHACNTRRRTHTRGARVDSLRAAARRETVAMADVPLARARVRLPHAPWWTHGRQHAGPDTAPHL